MTQEAMNNGIVLFQLGIDRKEIEQSQLIWNLTSKLQEVLASPVVAVEKKYEIIERVFTEKCGKTLLHFLKVMCRNQVIDQLNDIYGAFYKLWDKENHVKRVKCVFSAEPSDDGIDKIKTFLREQYPEEKIMMEIDVDSSILGGVIVKADDKEYDWSYENRIRQLEMKIKR